jgi:hypothetical protein
VDERDDAQRDKRVLEREPRQPPRCELAARSRQGAGERPRLTHVIIDLDREPVARRAQREVEGHVDVGERRYVEMLRDAHAKFSASGGVGVGSQEVGFHFAKGVRDLGDGGRGTSGSVVAEIERHRIEEIAEHTWQRDEDDAPAGNLHAVLPAIRFHSLPERPRRSRDGGRRSVGPRGGRFEFRLVHRQIVVVAKRVGVPPVDRKEPEARRRLLQFVEIESEEKNPVVEAVHPRRKPLVHHAALVETRRHDRDRGVVRAIMRARRRSRGRRRRWRGLTKGRVPAASSTVAPRSAGHPRESRNAARRRRNTFRCRRARRR